MLHIANFVRLLTIYMLNRYLSSDDSRPFAVTFRRISSAVLQKSGNHARRASAHDSAAENNRDGNLGGHGAPKLCDSYSGALNGLLYERLSEGEL